MFGHPVEVTKEEILKRYSQEQILEFYLGIPVKDGLFRSPLRKDNNPSCGFYVNNSGVIRFKDFATNENLDFVGVVMKIHNCTFGRALGIICEDFGLTGKQKTIPVREIQPLEKKESSVIRVQIQDWTKTDEHYWGKYHISQETRKKFKVYSLSNVWLNGHMKSSYSKNVPQYGYYFGKNENVERWKIYYPTKSSYRFLCNTRAIQGWSNLPPTGGIVIVTKSLKDVMVYHELGYPAIALQAESICITETLHNKLKERFTKIVINYDNDDAGIRSMNKMKKDFDVEFFIINDEKAKDISDYISIYGFNETLRFLTIKL